MTRITITISGIPIGITQSFTTKEYGSELEVIKAAIKWLKLGTVLDEEG